MQLDSTKERVFGLDLMRAFAISLVVFGHCLWIYPNAPKVVASVLQVFAFLGVEIFFVLSGFLIGAILYRLYVEQDFKLQTVFYFLKRRWFRTLPTYYLVLLINMLVAFLYGSLDSNVWRYFVFQQNFSSSMLPFFPESWSLSIEEYSYLMLPFFLLAASVIFKPKNRSFFFLIAVLLLIASSLLMKGIFYATTKNDDIALWNSSLKPVVIYRLDAIFIGVLCSWISLNCSKLWMRFRHVFCLLGFLSMAFLFIGIGYFRILIDNYPFFWNVLYLPIVSVVIALFLPILSQWKQSNSKLSQPVVFISIISYSIYLLHYNLILQLLKNNFYIDPQNNVGLHLFTAAYLSITLIISYFMYRFFEKPMTDLRDKD